jgi:hypothetical protein
MFNFIITYTMRKFLPGRIPLTFDIKSETPERRRRSRARPPYSTGAYGAMITKHLFWCFHIFQGKYKAAVEKLLLSVHLLLRISPVPDFHKKGCRFMKFSALARSARVFTFRASPGSLSRTCSSSWGCKMRSPRRMFMPAGHASIPLTVSW